MVSICFVLAMKASIAQNYFRYHAIDKYVQNREADNLDSLAKMLVAPYTADAEKARAIFSWIAQHISYNIFVLKGSRQNVHTMYQVLLPADTAFEWKLADEMTALKVLRKRIAVCDGYAKLFKSLCDYAGLRSQIITGYATCNEREKKFRTNHSWNAVLIDSVWRLLDVTWASGYVTYGNQFIQQLDESYFFTDPAKFIRDHYPEDLQWTLLQNPPTVKEYERTPFLHKSFIKYSISSYRPSRGIIEASVGDTIQIEIQIKDMARDKAISPDPFFDSSLLSQSASYAFLSPISAAANKVCYRYVFNTEKIEWLHVLYNDDLILRYKLKIK